MLLGRDSPGKDRRIEWAREWAHSTSPYAIAAGVLGIFAPIDGLLFFPLALAALVLGVLGLRDIRKHPERPRGRVLCFIGIVGGAIGFSLALALQLVPLLLNGESTGAPTPTP